MNDEKAKLGFLEQNHLSRLWFVRICTVNILWDSCVVQKCNKKQALTLALTITEEKADCLQTIKWHCKNKYDFAKL